MALPTRALGPFTVTAIGLGCMNVSHAYGVAPTHEEGVALVRAALDSGVTHLDTAALYGFGANEKLVGEAIKGRRDEITLASKCGMTGVDGKRVIDGRPDTIAATARESLSSLGTDVIDLYYLHRVDPDVPVEESIGAIGDLVAAGLVRAVGISEVSAATLRRAHATHPIAAVQNEYSLWSRNPELGVLDACRELGITLVAFSPLGRGFLTDEPPVMADLPAGDIRAAMPRFDAENYPANLALRSRLAEVARGAGVTVSQLALAWVLSRGEQVVAIPGTRSIAHLEEDLETLSIDVPGSALAHAGEIINADTVHGRRYGPAAERDTDAEAFEAAG